MANITDFLPVAGYNHIPNKGIFASALVDFTKKNAANGDTVDVLRIPKGAVVLNAGLVVHTTEATVTITLGDATTADKYLAATTLTNVKADNNAGTADGAALAADTTTAYQKFYGAEGLLRLTIGGANATTAKVTAFVEYFVVPGSRAV
jgi:hypothetical protein